MPWLLVAMVLQGALPQIPIRDAPPVTTGSATLSGRVTDKATGQPLAGVIVRIPAAGDGLEARTDADGVYRIRRVPAGSVILVAAMPDYRSTHLPQVYGDTGPPTARWTSGNPERIDIRAGEMRAGLDFALVRAFGISGRVVDDVGQPMSNILVRVESVGAEAEGAAPSRYTDDRGEFRVFGLAPGRYRVCADPTRFGYTDAVPPDAPATACYPAEGSNEQPLVLATTEPAPIQIQMRRGGTVTIAGTILDAAGLPAEGASVRLGRRGASLTATNYAVPIRTGAQFMAKGLSPGEYFIAASGGRAVDNGQIERQYAYVPLTIGSSDVTGLVITLTAPVDLTGRITVEEGDALPPGARLSVQAHLESRVASAFNRTVPTGVVGDDLTFGLNGVLGSATISCSGLPAGWVVKAVRYRGADVTDLAFAPAADARSLEVVISTRGAIVTGTVARGDTAATARTVIVRLFPTDSARRDADTAQRVTLVRPDGTFTLDAVRSGEYYIVATAANPWGATTPSAPTPDRLSRVAERITLGEGDRRTIELRVVKIPEER